MSSYSSSTLKRLFSHSVFTGTRAAGELPMVCFGKSLGLCVLSHPATYVIVVEPGQNLFLNDK